MTTILVTGNTYPVKDQIKALGGRWDADARGWRVPVGAADRARALVAGAGSATKATAQRKRGWVPGMHGMARGYRCPCCGDRAERGAVCDCGHAC